jgi:hypothetical protein
LLARPTRSVVSIFKKKSCREQGCTILYKEGNLLASCPFFCESLSSFVERKMGVSVDFGIRPARLAPNCFDSTPTLEVCSAPKRTGK